MTVAFDAIPADLPQGGLHTEIKANGGVSSRRAHVALIVAPVLAASTTPDMSLHRLFSPDDAEKICGNRSIGAAMARAFNRAAPDDETWVLAAIEAAADVAATGSIMVSGQAASAGTIALYIAGQRVAFSVSRGATAPEIAELISQAIQGADVLVTASAEDSTVTLTSADKSILANQIIVAQDFFSDDARQEPAGVTLAITQLSGGTGSVMPSSVIDAITDKQFDTIVWPWQSAADISEMSEELDRRWGPMVQMEGHLFAAIGGDLSAATTLGMAFNAAHVTVGGTSDSISPAFLWAAVLAGVDAAEPNPARPRKTLPMLGLRAPATRWSSQERKSAILGGVSTFKVDAVGNVLCDRLVTTYRVNAQGRADTSYREVTTLRTLAAMRYDWQAQVDAAFPRHNLAGDDDDFDAGLPIVQPRSIRALTFKIYREWIFQRGWAQNFKGFQARLVVEIDPDDPNRLNVQMQVYLVGKFLTLATSMLFRVGGEDA
ncbi:MAG: phage tail sheath subtilisin-like domain-containing protein [Myxococcales bacterium]|jgi:phage tail sheath gpL-like|nr:phage tail sheath subtilisin-like domain-containing protein [Myxococcales bacterium]